MNKEKGGSLFLILLAFSFLGCGQVLTASALESPSNAAQDVPTTTDPNAFNLKAQSDFYRQRYGLKNPYDKLIDNKGAGYENLYGIRNLRVVLHGIYYRGGANNTYNRDGIRDNENPLQNNALKNLCEEGFSESIYLYRTNFSTATKSTNCVNLNNDDQTLEYQQIDAFSNTPALKILTKIYDHIKGKSRGLIYAHCWNGWHASGVIAALSLRQFCGWSADDAVNYWIKNTDGDSNYPDHKQQIRDFKVTDALKITAEEQALICP